MNKLIKISSNENDEQEVTVKSSLIEANEFLSNMMFEEYQQKVKVKKETLGGFI